MIKEHESKTSGYSLEHNSYDKNNYSFSSKSQNMKGAIKSLEAVIAASILLVSLGVLFVQNTNTSVDNIKYQTYDALDYLDDSGKLRLYAKSDDLQSLNSDLKLLINYQFKAVFCKPDCNATGVPKDKQVVVIDHYISGYPDSADVKSDPKKLRLYIWE